jgi:hypothetical protein
MLYLHLILVVFFFLALADINYEKEYKIHIGIAHTRWATHGEPSSVNSHPQRSDPNNGKILRVCSWKKKKKLISKFYNVSPLYCYRSLFPLKLHMVVGFTTTMQSVPITTKVWVWILLMAGCTWYNIMW